MKIPIFPNNSFRQGKNFSWERTDPNCFHIKVDFLFLGADFWGFFWFFPKVHFVLEHSNWILIFPSFTSMDGWMENVFMSFQHREEPATPSRRN